MPAQAPVKAPVKTPSKAPSNPRKRKNDNLEKTPDLPVKKVRVSKQTVAKAKAKVAINQRPSQRLDVYVFGEGSSSELGLGTSKTAIDVKRPRLNPILSAQQIGVVHIVCGGMHVAALTHDNKILTWGVNDQGALGRDTTWEGGLKDMDDNDSDESDNSDSGLNPAESNPTAIPESSFPESTQFVKLAAGDSHTLALTDDGHVYGWGTFRVSTLKPTPQAIFAAELTIKFDRKMTAYSVFSLTRMLKSSTRQFSTPTSRTSSTSAAVPTMPWLWTTKVRSLSGVLASRISLGTISSSVLVPKVSKLLSSLSLFAPKSKSTKLSTRAQITLSPLTWTIMSGPGV